MHFWKQFRAKACSVSLAGASKDDVLRELVTNLVEGGALDAALSDKAFIALVEREKMATTGVGQNVAIPHVRVAGLTQAVAALSLHRAGLPWGSVDGDPVHLVFTVLRPDRAGELHDPEQHLEMMRWIARLSRSSDFRSFALQARTRTELVDLLKEMSAV
jgi:PTS system nitrogen regulatory IIA component